MAFPKLKKDKSDVNRMSFSIKNPEDYMVIFKKGTKKNFVVLKGVGENLVKKGKYLENKKAKVEKVATHIQRVSDYNK